MSADFNEMAAKAKRAHEAQTAELQREQNAERESRSTAVDVGISALEKTVLPILQRAKSDFLKNGIDSSIEPKYDVKNFYVPREPSILFRCLGPKRASDGYQFQAIPIFISSNGTTVTVGIGKNSFDRDQQEKIETTGLFECEQSIAKLLERALEFYFQELAKHRNSGTL